MEVAVIGAGYVGLVAAACFAELGNSVTGVDIDEARVEALRQGRIPIYEPGLEDLVLHNLRTTKRLRFTTDLAQAIPNAEVVFLCVPSPEGPDGRAVTTYVETAARNLAPHLRGNTIIVNKSTVPVGTASLVTDIVSQHAPSDATFEVVSNPEFLREGRAIEDFMHPDRIVIGAETPQAAGMIMVLYSPLHAPVDIVSPESAELIKYGSNALLATKIAFINSIARLCDAVGADIRDVAQGIGSDSRIGPAFLQPGPGFGGSCFPKDVAALLAEANRMGTGFEILDAVLGSNGKQRAYVVDKVRQAVGGSLDGVRLGIWGLSFKADTDDVRESPAVDIVERLAAEGAEMRVHDPVVHDEVFSKLGVERVADPVKAAADAEALVVLTEWGEYRSADLSGVASLLRQPLLIDARNLFEPSIAAEHGLRHIGVGRGSDLLVRTASSGRA